MGGKNGSASVPVVINNLKSALGIDGMNGKPDSQKNGLNLELVKKLVLNQLDKTQDKQEDNLHKAVNLADLKAIAQAGLSFFGE